MKNFLSILTLMLLMSINVQSFAQPGGGEPGKSTEKQKPEKPLPEKLCEAVKSIEKQCKEQPACKFINEHIGNPAGSAVKLACDKK